ncbi:MAG: HAD-IB family hydrolase [Actinobacteria bacterium]|nr:HAD-IB family hydrolase [Actinomycetota bacterium]
MSPAPTRIAAFFDLDKTVIAKASMAAFGGTLYRDGLLSRRILLRAAWSQLVFLHLGASEEKLVQIREKVLRLTKGWDRSRVRALVREAMDEVVEPIIYAEALELIEYHRAEGHRLVIVSASPVEIVEPLADYLDISDAIASVARVDENGLYTGEMERYSYGPYKAEAMNELAERYGLDLSESYAYSDSATDLPMLEAVGHPVAVNPDKVLARLAADRGWEVRHFVRPVRLRDRVPVPPPVPTAAIGLAAAAAGTAIAILRSRRRRPLPPPKRTAMLAAQAAAAAAAIKPVLRRSRQAPPSRRR